MKENTLFTELKQKYYSLYHDELFLSCAPFWLNNSRDAEFGGTRNCLDRVGQVYSDDKSVWLQGRAAWTYSYLCNSFGKQEEYAEFAADCLGFLKKNCIDSDGRMYFTVTRDGKPVRKRRYWFSETFYILGNAEYYMLSQKPEYLTEAKKYFDFVYGMYKDPATDPFKITPKSCAATRATKSLAEPMILLNVASVMRKADKGNETYYNTVIDGLITDIKCFYFPEYHALMENVSLDNELILEVSQCRVVNPGHNIECSWFLLEEGIYRQDEELKQFAKTIFDDAIARGWDEQYGGITYFKDLLGKPVEAYEHDMKLWWPHNEAAIASLMLCREYGDKKYYDWFEKITSYAFTHFSDRENGEWFGYLRRDGVPTEPPCKGHTYKGAFHVMRMLAKVLNIFNEA